MDRILKAALERDEGRHLVAYRDINNNWTTGVGHLLGSSPRMSSITDDECDALLLWDVHVAEDAAHAIFGPMLTIGAARYRAIVNMTFNRGGERVRTSTTITPAIKAALVNGNWKAVSDAVLASEWGIQIKDRGKRLAKQFETGVDQ